MARLSWTMMAVGAVAVALIAGCTGSQSAEAPATEISQPAAVEFPSPGQARTCDELLDQMEAVDKARIAVITDLNHVITLDDDAGPSIAHQRFVLDWVRRDDALGCRLMVEPPPGMLGFPDMEPVNRAQEMALAKETGLLEAVLRYTVDALARYKQEHGLYPSTIEELRSATSLSEPAEGIVVDIVSVSRETVCVRAEVKGAPYPVYATAPDRHVSFETC